MAVAYHIIKEREIRAIERRLCSAQARVSATIRSLNPKTPRHTVITGLERL